MPPVVAGPRFLQKRSRPVNAYLMNRHVRSFPPERIPERSPSLLHRTGRGQTPTPVRAGDVARSGRRAEPDGVESHSRAPGAGPSGTSWPAWRTSTGSGRGLEKIAHEHTD
jgi:hypothetical protein